MDNIEQHIRDRFESAYLFAFGDQPEPATGTVADPMKVAVAEAAMRNEMRGAILLLARELDALKQQLDAGGAEH